MPVKIILYVENIAMGTRVVEQAVASGAALGEFVQSDPPIKVKVPKALDVDTPRRKSRKPTPRRNRKTSKVKRASPNQKYKLHATKASKAPSGSVQGRVFAILNATPRDRTQRQMFAHLKRKGIKPGSAKTAVHALREQRILIPVLDR